MAVDTLAIGQAASQARKLLMGCNAQTAKTQAPDQTTPSMASGVTTRVTQGIASKLANKPTKDTWPKNSSVKGAKAKVTVACSRNKARLLRRTAWPVPSTLRAPSRCINDKRRLPTRHGGAPPSARSGASGLGTWRCEPEAINTPTATKLNQKPGCSKAQGSHASTTEPASNQTSAPCQWRADTLSKTTTPSIHSVRWAGTPQPLNKA
jgi:hypothetical protein